MSNTYWETLCKRVTFSKKKKKDEDSLHKTLECEFELTFEWPQEHIENLESPVIIEGIKEVIKEAVFEGITV